MTPVLPHSAGAGLATLSAETLAARAATPCGARFFRRAHLTQLVIHELAERFGIGTTRSAKVSRAWSRSGSWVAIGQRGFRVARVSREDLG
jgi:hypothetical protein